MSQAVTELESLKAKMKATWMSGDFDRVAQVYAPDAQAFVERLAPKPGERVLDVACGSGNLSFPAARAGADVTGIDIATNLVETARGRARAEGLNVYFDEGDAERMPYGDSSFDVVMTMFGAMFAPRPEVTASELLRVCKPGGRIAMANWTPTGLAGQMFALAGKYLPPPSMPPPVLWGDPETVKERFGDRVSDLKLTTRMAEMIYDMPPSE